MRNLALQLEYDGTGFFGSQLQAQGRTIQGELEQAWKRLTGEDVRWTLSGRTDAGVHALGQVANVRTATTHSLETVLRAMNALLPRDITAHEAWEVPEQFHSRFSARRREYRYLILNTPTPSALLRHRALWVAEPLKVAAMAEALATLVGQHDFSAFTGGGQEVLESGSTERLCFSATCRVEQSAAPFGALVQIDIAANAFLRHMVRNIVGTVLLVGTDRLDPAGFAAILEGRDRRRAGPTAPPHGLYLMSIEFDPAVAPLAKAGRA